CATGAALELHPNLGGVKLHPDLGCANDASGIRCPRLSVENSCGSRAPCTNRGHAPLSLADYSLAECCGTSQRPWRSSRFPLASAWRVTSISKDSRGATPSSTPR